jgi:hypothetical protein
MFEPARKSQSWLRLGFCGISGGGKTLTGLRVATGLANGGRVAVIDTEHSSASLYASAGLQFDVRNLDSFSVDRYIESIEAAEQAGYAVLLIDSLSHAWSGKDGILEFVDKTGKRNAGGGNFSAWRDATPRHNALIEAILSAKMHIIATMRSKTEYVVESVGGKTSIRKVGLAPVQRDGLEYEFTVCGDINQDHELIVTKTRAPFLKDAVIREPGEELGRQLREWLETGDAPAPQPFKVPQPPAPSIADTLARVAAASPAALESLLPRVEQRFAAGEITADQRSQIIGAISARLESATAEGGA